MLRWNRPMNPEEIELFYAFKHLVFVDIDLANDRVSEQEHAHTSAAARLVLGEHLVAEITTWMGDLGYDFGLMETILGFRKSAIITFDEIVRAARVHAIVNLAVAEALANWTGTPTATFRGQVYNAASEATVAPTSPSPATRDDQPGVGRLLDVLGNRPVFLGGFDAEQNQQ